MEEKNIDIMMDLSISFEELNHNIMGSRGFNGDTLNMRLLITNMTNGKTRFKHMQNRVEQLKMVH